MMKALIVLLALTAGCAAWDDDGIGVLFDPAPYGEGVAVGDFVIVRNDTDEDIRCSERWTGFTQSGVMAPSDEWAVGIVPVAEGGGWEYSNAAEVRCFSRETLEELRRGVWTVAD